MNDRPERIRAINLTNEPHAIAYLNQPQDCKQCEGTGRVIVQQLFEDGCMMISVAGCPLCQGSGYMVYTSWN